MWMCRLICVFVVRIWHKAGFFHDVAHLFGLYPLLLTTVNIYALSNPSIDESCQFVHQLFDLVRLEA